VINNEFFIIVSELRVSSDELQIVIRNIFTISIFFRSKAKIVEKAQFTGVNEHFETIFNAAMAKKTTREKVSYKNTLEE